MKWILLAATLLLAFIGSVPSAIAANPAQVTQLLETRVCIGCDLQRADLHGADLRGVNLSRANLQEADLRDTNLMAVNLQHADLRRANLTGATLILVDLRGANLRDAHVPNNVSEQDIVVCHTIGPYGHELNRDCDAKSDHTKSDQ